MHPRPSFIPRAVLHRTSQSYICPSCRYRRVSSFVKRDFNGRKGTRVLAQQLHRRAASTTPSITAVNVHEDIPPAFQRLHRALENLQYEAAVYIDPSQIKLAIRGLESENAVTRIAVLGNRSQDGARRLVRALLADPLVPGSQWEEQIMEIPRDGRALILRYAEEPDLDSRYPLVRTFSIPSTTLQTHKLEILVQEADLQEARDSGTLQSFLLPGLETPNSVSRVSTVRYPVHKTVVYSKGFADLPILANLEQEVVSGGRKAVVAGVADWSWDDLHHPTESTGIISPINLNEAEEAVKVFRESLENSIKYEHAWLNSGLPQVSAWLVEGTEGSSTVLKASVRRIIEVVTDSAEEAILAEELERSRQQEAAVIPLAIRNNLTNFLTGWAETAHGELRLGLDVAFNSRNWRKLAWWKLFWRIDDITSISMDVLQRSWVPESEKALIHIAGRVEQAGLGTYNASPYAATGSSRDPSSRQIGTSPPAPSISDLISEESSPLLDREPHPASFSCGTFSIGESRAELARTSIPALQASAQGLLIHSVSSTALAASLSALLYVSVSTTSLYEAGAVAAVGFVYSIRRLQVGWEKARKEWQEKVREEGRLALKRQEDEWKAVVAREKPRSDQELEQDREDKEARRFARDAVTTVREVLEEMER